MNRILSNNILVLALFAVLLTTPLPGNAAESADFSTARHPVLLGPLRLRDLTPFSLQRLDFLPAGAAARYPDKWAVEANLSYTNTFIMSEQVGEYLETRGDRAPLAATDFAALDAMDGNVFYFDGSIAVLNLTVHRTLSDRWAVYATVPVHHYGGGFLDGTIEGFHEKAGFSSFNREYVTRNRFQAYYRADGVRVVMADEPTDGFADPVMGARWRDTRGSWDIVLEAAAKLPVGRVGSLFSSGHADVGVQLSLQRQWDGQGLYFSLADVFIGGSDAYGDTINRHIPSATVAYEQALDERNAWLLQLTAARSLFAGETRPELSAAQYQASIGWRHVRDDWHLTLAFTENVINFNNTPDVGLHVGVGFTF